MLIDVAPRWNDRRRRGGTTEQLITDGSDSQGFPRRRTALMMIDGKLIRPGQMAGIRRGQALRRRRGDDRQDRIARNA